MLSARYLEMAFLSALTMSQYQFSAELEASRVEHPMQRDTVSSRIHNNLPFSLWDTKIAGRLCCSCFRSSCSVFPRNLILGGLESSGINNNLLRLHYEWPEFTIMECWCAFHGLSDQQQKTGMVFLLPSYSNLCSRRTISWVTCPLAMIASFIGNSLKRIIYIFVHNLIQLFSKKKGFVCVIAS